METLEVMLYNMIRDLRDDILAMRPECGFSSPTDIPLVTELNKKVAILEHLQKAMRVINPQFDINL